MDKLSIDTKYFDMVLLYGPKILTAIAILFIGLWLIRRLTEAAEIGMSKSGIEADLRPFLGSMLNMIFKVFLILCVANIVGIETTSFVAVLASAAFAVGLALQGTLSNFAAGVMLLIFKPYRVGDIVEIQGAHGKVKEIQIFNTIVLTSQEKIIIVPNGTAVNGIINNFTAEKSVRTNIKIPIRYNTDFEQVKQKIAEILRGLPKVLQDMESNIEIETFEQDGVIIGVYAPVEAENLEDVTRDLNHILYNELTAMGVKLGVRKNK